MTPQINLNALRVFATAARYGNFQRAAEALSISHGAVSQRIKGLEETLGIRLFEREARGVTLTAQGAAYYTEVAEALTRLETVTEDLMQQERPITLLVGPSFATKWLMPRLSRFRAAHPDLSLSTHVQDTGLPRALGRRELAVLPADRLPSRSEHHVHRLTALELVAVCHPDLARPAGPLSVGDLLSLPLLQDANRRWERLIAFSGHVRDPALLNFDRSALALDAALEGHGVAILPKHLIEDALHAQRLVTLWQDPTPSEEYLSLCWATAQDRDPALRRAINWVLAEFGCAPPPK